MAIPTTLAIALFLGLSYRRARGKLAAWQGWGTALTCGTLLALPLFLSDVLRSLPLPSLAGLSTADPLAMLSALGSLFLIGLGVAFCATLLADLLVSLIGLEPARSSELAQTVRVLKQQGSSTDDIKRLMRRRFFVAKATLEALVQ